MQDTTLIRLLRTFNPKEMKEFRKFVYSPFHNDKKIVARFFDVIRNYYPSFSANTFTKEDVYSIMYPGRTYKDGDIRKLTSYLLSLAEDYLSFNFYRNESYFRRKFLIEELNSRGAFFLFDKKFDELYSEYDDFKGQFDDYFLNKYYLENSKINYLLFTRKYHLLADSMVKRIDNLIYFFLITLFYNYVNLLKVKSRFSIDSNKFKIGLELLESLNPEALMNELKSRKNKHYPILSAYYYSFMSFMNKGKENYFVQFKELLGKVGHKLSWIDRFNLYIDLGDICSHHIRHGKPGFHDTLIEIYDYMLNNKLYSYYENGFFTLNVFMKMIKESLNINKFNWAEDFVKNFIGKLPEETRQNTLYFCTALLAFHKKDFDLVLSNLSVIDYEVFALKFDARELMLKAYYELNYYEQIFSLADSYKHFIDNTDIISETDKIKRKQFANAVVRFTKVKVNHKYDEIPLLRNSVKNFGIISKSWFLEKIKELESKDTK